MAYLSLTDWARRMDPDGEVAEIAELLAQCNEIFKEMPIREGNLATGHQATVRIGLPAGVFRSYNQGVAATVSKTAQFSMGCGLLSAKSQIDKKMADSLGDVEGLRAEEDNAHLEGMSQTIAQQIFYGNVATNPQGFQGLGSIYYTVNSSNSTTASNVLDAGGTGSNNTSIYLAAWGDNYLFGFFPKGSEAGIKFQDLGEMWPGVDANGNQFPAYTSWFDWHFGIFPKNWKYGVRIANIDVTAAGLAGSNAPDLYALMSKAAMRPTTLTKRLSGITETDAPNDPAPGIVPAWYVNRSVREYLDIQAIRDKNVLLRPTEYAGEPVLTFRDAPIRLCDALINTEARVT